MENRRVRPMRPRPRATLPVIWVTGRKPKDGKMALLGWYQSDDEADEIMFDAFPNDTGRKHYLMTTDRAKATSQLKHILFTETHDLDKSMENISHVYKGGRKI